MLTPIQPPKTPQGLAYKPGYILPKDSALIHLGLITPKRHGVINPSVKQQIRDIFATLSETLQSLGPSAKIVKVTRLLREAKEIWDIQPVFEEFFGADELPASTLIQVPACSEAEARVELEVWAVLLDGNESGKRVTRVPGPDGLPLAVSTHHSALACSGKIEAAAPAGQDAVAELKTALGLIEKDMGSIDPKEGLTKVTLLMTDIKQWPACREVFIKRYGGQGPAVTPIAVPRVKQPDASIEVDATYVGSDKDPLPGLAAMSGQPAIPVFVGGPAQDTYKYEPAASVADQTRLALENIETILKAAGLGWADVTASRWYITNIDEWPQIEEVAHAVFGSRIPDPTVVEVSALVAPAIRVEPDVWAVSRH